MSAKELKTLIELATSVDYTGGELKQPGWRECAQAHELERLKVEKNAETERLRCESET